MHDILHDDLVAQACIGQFLVVGAGFGLGHFGVQLGYFRVIFAPRELR